MKRPRLSFYLFRLRKASPAEILHRLRDQLLYQLIKFVPALFRKSFKAPIINMNVLQKLQLPELYGDITPETVSALLGGQVFCLNQDPREIAAFEAAEQKLFFTAVGPRGADPDIRAVWEPARLQHLTLLLVHLSRNPEGGQVSKIIAFLRERLFVWLAANPFLRGPHYFSAMECALRIPVFLLALKTLPRLTPGENARLLKAVFEHAGLIEHRLSLGSSLGNHTVTEAVGLVLAGVVFEQYRPGKRWLKRGLDLLKRESVHQILEDGGPAEQSLNYHGFVIDLYTYVLDFLEANKRINYPEIRERLKRAEAFRSAFSFSNGQQPAIGDSDDGFAVAPGLRPAAGDEAADLPWPQHIETTRFIESGYTIFRGPHGLHLTFDHGPLGMAPMYNHGHADALSVTLAAHGRPFLIDPGTYRYNGRPEERAYFKGTRAHNTVTIDGRDQARQLTGFIWDHPYRTIAVPLGGEGTMPGVLAAHDGYAWDREPVIHFRLAFFPRPDMIVIRDTFSGRGRHLFEGHFHLHPAVRVDQADGWTILMHDNTRIFMKFIDNEPRLRRGERDPMLGWFSPAYGLVQETTVLETSQHGLPEDVRFITIICLDPRGPSDET